MSTANERRPELIGRQAIAGPFRSNWQKYRDALAAAHGYRVEVASRPPATTPRPARDTALDLARVTRFCTIGIFIILFFAALEVTKAVTLPITAGIILGLFMGRGVDRLCAIGLPRTLAAGLISLALVLLLLTAAALLAAPFALWFDQMPALAAALRARFDWLVALVQQVEALSAGGASPVVVTAESGSGPILGIALTSTAVLAGFGLAMLTMFFFLTTRRSIKAAALRLCLGREARKSAGDFFERIERRVGHYLGVVTIINAMLGAVAALLIGATGLPYAVAWGALVAGMNYIPVIGPLIVVVGLVAAGLVTFPDSVAALLPAVLYFTAHSIESQLITPALVGRRLLLSPALVFVSFAFWLWLWGPVGAILSTPLLLIASSALEVVREHAAAEEEASDAGSDVVASTAAAAGTAPAQFR